MDPDTIKTIQEIGQFVAPLAAAPTVKELVLKMLGPTADALGERLAKNVKRCFDRSDQMVTEARVTAIAPEPNLLLPLAQAASIAENETLQEMFAALLTNARIPQGPEVRPSFISIASQLAPDEAVLLKRIASLTNEYQAWLAGAGAASPDQRDRIRKEVTEAHVRKLRDGLPAVENESAQDRTKRMNTCILILEGLGLVKRMDAPTMTDLGWALILACAPPSPKTLGQ
jgi:hypothetical protein